MTGSPKAFAHPSFHGLMGVARRDITPPVGIYARNWGASRHDVAEGIHRPLTFAVLVLCALDQQVPPMALAAVDVCAWASTDVEWSIRKEVMENLGTEESRIMINLGHTHAGGPLFVTRGMEGMPGCEHVGTFYEKIRRAAIEATSEAFAGRREATLAWSSEQCALATNRDLPDPGQPRHLCGFNPAQPADSTLVVGRITDKAGNNLATLVNYACHPTTLAWENRLISPDYVGALREVVETHTGGAPCLFLQGPLGDLAPREQYSGDPALADRHGRQLGYGVLSALEGMLPSGTQYEYSGVVESGAPLAAWSYAPQAASSDLRALKVTVELPLKAEVPMIAELDEQLKTCDDRLLSEKLRRRRILRGWVGDGVTSPLPIWAWKVGHALLLGQPTEPYSRYQIELRKEFRDRLVVVMGLVNGSIGYQPPRELYDQQIYQVWQTPYAAGSLERTTAAAGAALRQLVEDSRGGYSGVEPVEGP